MTKLILPSHLQQVVDLMKSAKLEVADLNGYYGVCDFVLRNGQHFTPQPLPKEYERGKLGHCYEEAVSLALEHSRTLTYCEGFAVGDFGCVIPTLHAWVVDFKGRVIDPAWENKTKKGDWYRGTEYYGVPIRNVYLMRRLCRQKTHGLIDNWQEKFPMFQHASSSWKSTRKFPKMS